MRAFSPAKRHAAPTAPAPVAASVAPHAQILHLQRTIGNRAVGHLLRGTRAGAAGGGSAPPIVHEVLAGGGRPLEPGARAVMERGFGRDFGGVRVHTGTRAAASAAAVDATAYTVGRNIVFADGQYAPETPAGARLLAHELAHVAQQGDQPAGGPLAVSRPGDGAERAAESAATAVTGGGAAPHLGAQPAAVRRVLNGVAGSKSNSSAPFDMSEADEEELRAFLDGEPATPMSSSMSFSVTSSAPSAVAEPPRTTATGMPSTAHGLERVAGPAATRNGVLNEAEIAEVRQLGFISTIDGAKVYLLEVEQGKFNAVVWGDHGLITTFTHLSKRDVAKKERSKHKWRFGFS